MSTPIVPAIVCAASADLVDLSRKVLKQFNINDITTTNDVNVCKSKLTSQVEAILLLDWGMGEAACADILTSTQAHHPCGVRPIFMFARSEDVPLQGMALEFGVMQVHMGPISHSVFESRIKKLLTTQTFNKEVRDNLDQYMMARRAGKNERAKEFIEDLFTKYPDDEFFAAELAEVYFVMGKLEEAEKTLEPYLGPTQKNPRILNIHGRCLMRQGRFQEATVFLQQADLINPYNIKRLLSLGEAYMEIDHPQRAKASFQKALTLDPESSDAKKGLGQSLLLLGDVNEALVYLRQISDAAEMAAVFNVAAVIAIRSGRHEDGMKLYRIACKTVGEKQKDVLSKLAFNMGLAHYRLNDFSRALYFFDISRKLLPTYEKASLGYNAVESKVPKTDRFEIGTDLMAALLVEIEGGDSLEGEDFEFRSKVANYETDF